MDHLRSNLAGYYTPQQYTPVPLPAYPPPTAFSNPSPYSRNELHHSFHQGFDPTLAHPQNVARLQAVAANAGPATALESVDEDTNLDESIDIAIEVAKRKTKSGSAAKGFPRTSAVYQIDRDGTKRRVVAEDFRAEVEERTRSGESCEAIADALIAQGVQVTSKSISRWRILWGFRKRAVRKQSKPPKPRELRINNKRDHQSVYRTDITRMSQQGLQAEEIAHIMTTRGMALKKGASTIARLQTVWKLRGDDESRIKNKRYLSRRKAREQQIEEFKNYAVDLGLENPKDWIRKKMEEPAVKQMRHEAACELMGDDAPTLRSLGEKGRPRKLRGGQFGQIANGTQASAAQAVTRLEGLSHDEDSAADAPPVTRTLRSKRVSRNDTDVALEQMERQDTEEESSDANSDYDHMDGVDQSNNQIIGFHDGNRYYPMMEQDDDDDDLDENDDDDEKQESTAHQPHNVQSQNPAMHPSAGITNATMALVPPAEEQDSIKRLMGTADGCIAAAQLLKDLLQAQSEGRPAPRSLSGLPPSVKDIDVARRKLREAVQSTATFM